MLDRLRPTRCLTNDVIVQREALTREVDKVS